MGNNQWGLSVQSGVIDFGVLLLVHACKDECARGDTPTDSVVDHLSEGTNPRSDTNAPEPIAVDVARVLSQARVRGWGCACASTHTASQRGPPPSVQNRTEQHANTCQNRTEFYIEQNRTKQNRTESLRDKAIVLIHVAILPSLRLLSFTTH